MRIRAFGSPYDDFQDLTLEQAGEAVERSANEGFTIELYLDPPGRNPKWEPALGLIFKDGVYICHGLGDNEFSRPIQAKFAPLIGKTVGKTELVSLLK